MENVLNKLQLNLITIVNLPRARPPHQSSPQESFLEKPCPSVTISKRSVASVINAKLFNISCVIDDNGNNVYFVQFSTYIVVDYFRRWWGTLIRERLTGWTFDIWRVNI